MSSTKLSDEKVDYIQVFSKNIIAGMGFMIGATIGFALFIFVLSQILGWLGGLPIVGNFFANLIHLTDHALEIKKSVPITNY